MTAKPWELDENGWCAEADRHENQELIALLPVLIKIVGDYARLRAVNAELLAELSEVYEWALTEKAPLRDQEIKSIKSVIANARKATP